MARCCSASAMAGAIATVTASVISSCTAKMEVVALGPEVCAGLGLHDLCCDTDPIAGVEYMWGQRYTVAKLYGSQQAVIGTQHRADILAAGDREAPLGPLGHELDLVPARVGAVAALPANEARLRRRAASVACRLRRARTIVAEHIAQPVQRMADRRLAEPEPLAGAGDAALFDQCVGNAQQVQIEREKCGSCIAAMHNYNYCASRNAQ